MNDLEIRAMSPSDSDAVSLFVEDLIQSLPYYNDRAQREETGKYDAKHLAGMVKEDPNSILIAILGQTMVGFCISRYDDGIIWLAWFGVADAYRGKGIGAMLLRALEATVHSRGCHKIWCDTRTENLPSQRVLLRAGFKSLCTLHNHWYGQDFILWEKTVE